MSDEDVRYAQDLARSERREVAKVEQECASLEYKIYEQSRIIKSAIYKLRIELFNDYNSRLQSYRHGNERQVCSVGLLLNRRLPG